MTSPTPPTTLPQYLADGLPKQDEEKLRDIQAFIDELLATREQPLPENELPNGAEVIENKSSDTVYLEYRTCGDESCSCMSGGEKHGLYKYRAYRDGDTVRREYLGKATETNAE